MSKGKALGAVGLALITAGSVDSIRNLPATALFGPELIIYFILAAILFLIPTALVTAELASNIDEPGGVYVWVRDALGQRMGLFAIWLQWIENVIWYPTILSFVAGTVAYVFSPHLAQNPYYLMGVILVFFWGTTALNCMGMKSSAWMNHVCVVLGLILPMILIIVIGLSWVITHPTILSDWGMQLKQTHHHSAYEWEALIGIILSFCGLEVASVHSEDVIKPKRDYPMALLMATLFIFVTLLLGSLSLVAVLTHQHISLVAGMMQAFSAFLKTIHMTYLLPVLGVLLVMGALAGVNNWIIAPSRGLHFAMLDLSLNRLGRVNRHGAPWPILLIQGGIVTVMTGVFLWFPTVNASYWFLTALTAQLYMMMYFLMFISALVLRKKRVKFQHHTDRGFVIPGGAIGLGLVCLMGMAATLLTISLGFVPPVDMGIVSVPGYVAALLLGLFILSVLPFLFFWCQKVVR